MKLIGLTVIALALATTAFAETMAPPTSALPQPKYKIVLTVFAILGGGGSTVPMSTTVMPGTYSVCPNNIQFANIKEADNLRVGVVCISAETEK